MRTKGRYAHPNPAHPRQATPTSPPSKPCRCGAPHRSRRLRRRRPHGRKCSPRAATNLAGRCPSPPASSRAVPGRPARSRSRWREDPFGRRRSATAGRRRGDRRAGRPRLARPTTGSPPGWPASRPPTAGSAWSCSRCAGRCGSCARTRRPRSRRCASCATPTGRWLAGRRAAWVATWAGRWALGAGGAVEVGEDPTATLDARARGGVGRRAGALAVEALVCTAEPAGHARRPGLGRRTAPRSRRDPEHDEHAWWPRDVGAWPDEADRARGTWRAARPMITLNSAPEVPLVHAFGHLPGAARRWRSRTNRARSTSSAGPRDRLDRHVAALHRRRAARA